MSTPQKEWTIMIYMAGDNNLSEDMVAQLKELKTFADKGCFNLIAVYDSSYPPAPVKIYDFSKQPGTPIPAPGSQRPLANYLVQIPTGSLAPVIPEAFGIEAFVKFVVGELGYRTTKNALILSGHSDGVIGRRILRDDDPPSSFNVCQLREVLEDSIQILGRDSDGDQRKFDLLGFDGCLMSMVEAAFEFRDVASVMVASEGNIPNSGWNYTEVFRELASGTGAMRVRDFAESIVEEYANFNEDFVGSGRSVDIAAVDLREVGRLAAAIDTIAEQFIRFLDLRITVDKSSPVDEIEAQFRHAIFRELFIDVVQLAHLKSQTYMHEQAVDLLDFLCALEGSFDQKSYELNSLAALFMQKEESAAFYKKRSDGKPVENNEQRCDDNVSIIVPGELKSLLREIRDQINLIFEIALGRTDRNSRISSSLSSTTSPPSYLIHNRHVGADYQFSKGISIFFPWTAMAYDLIDPVYRKMEFSRHRRSWRKFIRMVVDMTIRDKCSLICWSGVSFSDQLEYLKVIKANREHEWREHEWKEHEWRGGDIFYRYLEKVRNYSHNLDIQCK